MPVLDSPKQELACQERAKGKTEVEAYEIAGYSPNEGNANKFFAKPEVQARVKEITSAGAVRAEVTIASLIRELDAAAELARECKQCATLVAVVKEKGVLTGLRVERAERGEAGEFDKIKSMNGTELADFIARRSEARRLRGTPAPASGGTGEAGKLLN